MLTVEQAHQQIATGRYELDADTTIVVDRAGLAAPDVLADLAEQADERRARVVLVDGDDRGWPPAPSAPMLKLLHRDLPWSVTLSVESATPPRRALQPDRDAVLDQAERCDPAILTDEVTDALEERRRLRRDHESGNRFHNERWRLADNDQDRTRDSGRER